MRSQPNSGRVTGHVFLVKRKRGPSWYAKWREPSGRQVQKRLGPAWQEKSRPPAGFLTKRMAQEWLAAKLTDLRRGIGERITTGATFEDAANEWLRYVEHDRKRRPSTVTDYKRTVRARLIPEFGDLPLEGVTTERIDTWRARLVADGGLSDRSVNKLLVILHGIFRRAQRVHGLPTNPVANVERQPQRCSGDFIVLSPLEVEAVARAAEVEQDAALFRVAAFTGLRLGEVLALRWSDLDFSKRLVHVRRSFTYKSLGVPKSGRVRSVPLIDQAATVLENLSRRERFTDDADLVFCRDDGGFLDESRLRRRFYDARERAKLNPALRFHDLRHTFGTISVQAFPLSDVQAFMGHADIQTTMVYVHHVPQHDAAEKLSRVFAASDDFPLTVGQPAGQPA